MLRRNPGFTLTAIITLALGFGANTAIFSVIYGVLLRPLPYKEGHRLVVLNQQARLKNVNSLGCSVKEFQDYRDQNKTMEMVEHHAMSFILYGRGEPERVQTSVVSANFFDVLGVKPILGRRSFRKMKSRAATPCSCSATNTESRVTVGIGTSSAASFE